MTSLDESLRILKNEIRKREPVAVCIAAAPDASLGRIFIRNVAMSFDRYLKEQQMDLFADRTSTHWMASNQLRLWFSTFAHLIMSTQLPGLDPTKATASLELFAKEIMPSLRNS